MNQVFWYDLLGNLGGIAVIAAGVVGALYKGLKYLSGKWLENRFAVHLRVLEAEQQIAIRHIQSTIDRELDRARRLHAKEFDALSESWDLLHGAYWLTMHLTSRGQSIVDLADMTEAQLDAFFEASSLRDWQKVDVRAKATVPQMQKAYEDASRRVGLSDAIEARRLLRVAIDKFAIFIRPELKTAFEEMIALIDDAQTEFEVWLRSSGPRVFKAADALRGAQSGTYATLELRIRERLWSAAPTVTAPSASSLPA